jgi:hypothetical protein
VNENISALPFGSLSITNRLATPSRSRDWLFHVKSRIIKNLSEPKDEGRRIPNRPDWEGSGSISRLLKVHSAQNRPLSFAEQGPQGPGDYPTLRLPQRRRGNPSGYFKFFGTPGKDRTCDLRIRNPSLYPLSYGGTHPDYGSKLTRKRTYINVGLGHARGRMHEGDKRPCLSSRPI